MTTQTRTNLLYGFLALVAALLVLLRALNVFPPYIADVITRAAPVLLVILGLAVLLRNRVPFGSVIAVVVGLALVGGISAAAFNIRQSQMRDDYEEMFPETVDDDVILLRMRLQTLDTDVEIVRAAAGSENRINAQFVGSVESEIIQNYLEEDDGSATYNLNEVRQNPVPMLEDVGRGTLLVEVPAGTPVDVQLDAANGSVRMNMSDVALERLNLNLRTGDAIVTLPDYEPQLSTSDETLGTWAVGSGSLVVRVPAGIAARFDMSQSTGGDPDYDPNTYNLLFGRDILEARNFDTADTIVRYNLTVNRDNLAVTQVEP